MASQKRKRGSTDSAIADMSGILSQESFPSDSSLAPTEDPDDFSTQQATKNDDTVLNSQIGRLLQFHGDCGTAASMRPRRQTQPQAPANMVGRPAPKRTRTRTVSNGKVISARTSMASPLAETVERYQGQVSPLGPPRRSARSRRPFQKTMPMNHSTSKEANTRSAQPHIELRPGRSISPLDEAQLGRRDSLIVHLKLQSNAGRDSMPFSSTNDSQVPLEDEQAAPETSHTARMCSSFASTQSGPFAQPQSACIPLDSQDLIILGSSQAIPPESILQKPRQSSPSAESDLHHADATSSTSQISTVSTLILPSSQAVESQTVESQISSTPNGRASASQNSTVPTQMINPPHVSCYSPPPTSTPSVLFGIGSHELTDSQDDLHGSTDDPHLPIDDPRGILNQQQLHHVADQLFAHRDLASIKPEPLGQPAVWADGRQELCETLHYFRSYQSACYCTGGFVRAFMFDKIAHPRDYIDSNVVISRAGGGLVKDQESGEMRSGRDQVEDTVSQALKNCMRHHNPVVIITGIDNPHIPSKPPHQYCILDYFKPTHVWSEKSGKGKIVKYRFEKLNAKKESWWQAKDVKDPVELGALPPPFSTTCQICDFESPQIYLNGWMCLKASCPSFWHICKSGRIPYEPDETSLTYDPRFLKQNTSWPNDNHDYPLTSSTVELSGFSIPGEDTSQAFWLGMVCPKCGRCNSRINWTGWECLNVKCDFEKKPPHTIIPAISLREPLWPMTDSYTLSRDTHAPLVTPTVTFAHGYRINRYQVPGIDGFITHMIANKTVIEESGGPDAMFHELQQIDIGLARRSLPNGQLKGDSYTRHFLVNYGMPYKFIAATASRSFTDAARPVTATRSRLNWAASYLLSQEPGADTATVKTAWKTKEFNEVLALGYFEAQKINYHDDGEHGLGPTIATLSLGAPGTMRIRMKARHYHGVSSAGVYDDAPPLPGCAAYEARRAAQPALEALRRDDVRAWRTRLKKVPKELGLRSAGNAKDVLRLELGHGDIVVMHGEALQRYYEHAVEHAGKLRFALTCRYIDPESLAEADRPEFVVGEDQGGYDGTLLGTGGG